MTTSSAHVEHRLKGALLQLFGQVLFPDGFSQFLLGLGSLTQLVSVLHGSHFDSLPGSGRLVDLGRESLFSHDLLSDGSSFGDGPRLLFSLLAVGQQKVELSNKHVLVVLEVALSEDKDTLAEEVGVTMLAGGGGSDSFGPAAPVAGRSSLALLLVAWNEVFEPHQVAEEVE